MTAAAVPIGEPPDSEVIPVIAAIRAIEAAVRTALDAIRAANAHRIAAQEGMAVEAALRCFSGAGSADIATLHAAAELLDRLPALDRFFGAGRLPWAHLLLITVNTRRFRPHQYDAFDTWVDDNAARLAQLDLEHQAAVLVDALDQLATVRSAERADENREMVDRFVLQLQLDGSSESYGRWSPESTALLVGALHAEADAPVAPPCPTSSGSDPVDVDDADPAHGPSGSRCGQLAAQRHQPDIVAATRRAVIARDGGCRWPNCTAPVTWCDIHHVKPRAANGDHAPGNLVLLCRRHHVAVHRRGWRQHVADDATYTLKRRGRTIESLPRHLNRIPPPRPPDKAHQRSAYRNRSGPDDTELPF